MLYWEMKLEKNATWQANRGWSHDRVDFECRSEVYDDALVQMQKALAAFGFQPEKDVIVIRLRVHEHEDPSYNFDVVAAWSTCPYGDTHPLTLGMLGLEAEAEARRVA